MSVNAAKNRIAEALLHAGQARNALSTSEAPRFRALVAIWDLERALEQASHELDDAELLPTPMNQYYLGL